jgi:uncharacterized membrane-anchored protein
MNTGLLVIGTLVLVAGIFGYMYAEDQQGLLQQGEDAIQGDSQDWGLIQSLSAAGVVAGLVMVVAGLLPDEWYSSMTDDRV